MQEEEDWGCPPRCRESPGLLRTPCGDRQTPLKPPPSNAPARWPPSCLDSASCGSSQPPSFLLSLASPAGTGPPSAPELAQGGGLRWVEVGFRVLEILERLIRTHSLPVWNHACRMKPGPEPSSQGLPWSCWPLQAPASSAHLSGVHSTTLFEVPREAAARASTPGLSPAAPFACSLRRSARPRLVPKLCVHTPQAHLPWAVAGTVDTCSELVPETGGRE